MNQRPLVPSQEKISHIEFVVKGRVDGRRLDSYLGKRFTDYSRSFLQKLIKDGHVLIDGKPAKASSKIREGQQVHMNLPELEPLYLQPEAMQLDILYEDKYLAVLNKKSGLVMHPCRGHMGGTLANALLAHFASLSDCNDVYRPGIVHRLDRDTSGVLLIAKNNKAHAGLAQQFEHREVRKEYLALAEGEMRFSQGTIELPLAIDPRNRERMAIRHGGKNASTDYRVLARYPGFTLVHVFPRTGRTHQIRIHLKSQGHPLVGDNLYGAPGELSTDRLMAVARRDGQTANKTIVPSCLIDRQALHAWRISFTHPETGEQLRFCAPLPDDFHRTLAFFHNLWPRPQVIEILNPG